MHKRRGLLYSGLDGVTDTSILNAYKDGHILFEKIKQDMRLTVPEPSERPIQVLLPTSCASELDEVLNTLAGAVRRNNRTVEVLYVASKPSFSKWHGAYLYLKCKSVRFTRKR